MYRERQHNKQPSQSLSCRFECKKEQKKTTLKLGLQPYAFLSFALTHARRSLSKHTEKIVAPPSQIIIIIVVCRLSTLFDQ